MLIIMQLYHSLIISFDAFAKYFSILTEAIKVNNEYRKDYELDEREKEQNVHYKPV